MVTQFLLLGPSCTVGRCAGFEERKPTTQPGSMTDNKSSHEVVVLFHTKLLSSPIPVPPNKGLPVVAPTLENTTLPAWSKIWVSAPGVSPFHVPAQPFDLDGIWPPPYFLGQGYRSLLVSDSRRRALVNLLVPF